MADPDEVAVRTVVPLFGVGVPSRTVFGTSNEEDARQARAHAEVTEAEVVGLAAMIMLLRELERDIRAGNVRALALTATRRDASMFERHMLAGGAMHELVGALTKHATDLCQIDVRPSDERSRSEPRP